MIKHKECKESQRAKVTVGRRQMSDVERSHIMNHKLCYLLSQHVAYKEKMHSFPKLIFRLKQEMTLLDLLDNQYHPYGF